MIIAKTPFRMSFFGGGTDMPEYFKEHKGSVISTTFDKYCYVTVRNLPKFFDYKTHLTYSKTEYVNSIDEIQHPAIRNAMKFMNTDDLRITYDSDLPARSGLGTSSSFAVGLLNCLHALKGEYADKKKLSDEAIYLERTLCSECGGWQDQIAASFGGFNRIDFSGNEYDVSPIIMSPERKEQLNSSLLMFFTGFTRMSSDIQKENNISNEDKFKQLSKMYDMVDIAQNILCSNDKSLDDFGCLLDETWKLKRGIGKAISNNSIDAYYDKGIEAGALGGKLLGAGGGGFLVFYVPESKKKDVMDALKDLLHIPFKFESSGTKIINYFNN